MGKWEKHVVKSAAPAASRTEPEPDRGSSELLPSCTELPFVCVARDEMFGASGRRRSSHRKYGYAEPILAFVVTADLIES